MDALPAGTLLGNYRIREVAGRGAVGVVYEAEHIMLGRTVAVKMLNPAHADQTVFRQRFSREGRGAASVQHPNIITVFDAGEHDGSPYLVMDFVDGPDLEQVLASRGGRLPPSAALSICRAVADALDAAASQGFAHRDVKPANILLERWGSGGQDAALMPPHVYLTDFGLIKSSAEVTVTQTGSFVGTLLYMSPEQIQGEAVPASDQYSLACVLWECLTGGPPYEPQNGEPLSLLSAHLHADVPAISDQLGLPSSGVLDAVFRRALDKQPDRRFDSVGAFVDAVAQALDTADPTVTFPVLEPTPPLPDAVVPDGGEQDTDAPVRNPGGPAGAAADSGSEPPATRRTEERARPFTPPPATPPPGTPVAPTFAGVGSGPGDPSQPPVSGAGRQPRRRGLLVLVLAAVLVAGVLAAVALRPDGEPDDEVVVATAVESADGAAGTAPAPTDTAPDDAADPSVGPIDPAALAEQGRVAFVGDGDIWISHVDGTAAVNLTQGQYSNPAQPAWRPGAQSLVFSSADGLQLVDISNGDGAPIITALTDDGGHTDPAWSPTGDRLLVSVLVGEDQRDLAILEPGGAPEPIGLVQGLSPQQGRVLAQRPTWQSDEGTIAFQLTNDTGPRVWTSSSDGSDAAPLDGAPEGPSFHPQFRPGTSELVFTNRPEGGRDTALWVADLAGRLPEPLAITDDLDVRNADYSPCGDVIVSEVGDGEVNDLAVFPAGGGDPTAGSVPKPAGVLDTSDPAWHGQACP